MKNVSHPNMFGVGARAAAAPSDTIDKPIDAEENVALAGSESAPPAGPWANPVGKLQTPADAGADGAKRQSRIDQVIAFLREKGPSTSGQICKGVGLASSAGIAPYVAAALKDGRIARVDGKYCVGVGSDVGSKEAAPSATDAAQAPAPAQPTVPTPAAPAEAAAAIAAMRQPAAGSAPAAIAHFDAATAIVAKRKQGAAPTSEPAATPLPAAHVPTGRKPEFVVFVDDVQLLAWPNGDLTLQTERGAIELKLQHFRALIALAKLRE